MHGRRWRIAGAVIAGLLVLLAGLAVADRAQEEIARNNAATDAESARKHCEAVRAQEQQLRDEITQFEPNPSATDYYVRQYGDDVRRDNAILADVTYVIDTSECWSVADVARAKGGRDALLARLAGSN